MTVRTVQQFRNVKCSSNVFDREAINIKSIMVEDWFGHVCPRFDYEHEHRFTEYEHRFTEHEHDGIYSLPERVKSRGNEV